MREKSLAKDWIDVYLLLCGLIVQFGFNLACLTSYQKYNHKKPVRIRQIKANDYRVYSDRLAMAGVGNRFDKFS